MSNQIKDFNIDFNKIVDKQENLRVVERPLDKLFSALAKAQGEMESASKDSKNPFFKSKYADLNSVISASRPYLSKHGLSVIQPIMSDERGDLFVYTILCHESGQSMQSRMPVKPMKSSIQDIGAYISYVRRYSYASFIGVIGSDEDDDGESAMNRETKVQNLRVNGDQIKIISTLTKQLNSESIKKFFDHYSIKTIHELSSEKFEEAIKKLKITINAKKEIKNENS